MKWMHVTKTIYTHLKPDNYDWVLDVNNGLINRKIEMISDTISFYLECHRVHPVVSESSVQQID